MCVQMINDNYRIIHSEVAKQRYPKLYDEVVEHDRLVSSSWYDLSDEAYEEYNQWVEDSDV